MRLMQGAQQSVQWYWQVGLRERKWRLATACALLALLLLVAEELLLLIPLSEHVAMLPARASAWAAAGAPPVRSECAPCGCARGWGEALAAAFAPACISDAELGALAASDRGPQGAAAAAQAAALEQRIAPHATSVEACHGILAELHASSSSSSSAAAAPAAAAPPAPAGSGGRLFHMYWKPDTVAGFHAVHAAVVESWLVSQPEEAVLVFWVPVPQAPPSVLLPLVRAFPARLRIRALDILWEARGSPVENSFMLRLTDKHSWIDGDFARLVLLWRYGGFYMDVDVLMLRDASPLLASEFYTEFACWGGANGAVLRLFAGGTTATGLLRLAAASPPKRASWMFGPLLLERFRDTHAPASEAARLRVLPWCFFHGIWCGALPRDGLEGAAPWSRQQLDGVFGLHLHGAAKEGGAIDRGSIIGTKMVENRAVLVERLRRAAGAGAGGAAHAEQLAPLVFARQAPWWVWWK